MQKINVTLPFATLLPEFIYQFLSADQVDQGSFTCVELEDLRLALINANEPELLEIRQFLHIVEGNVPEEGEETEDESGEETDIPDKDEEVDELEKLEGMLEQADEEMEEIDDEYYHRYTAAELRFICEKIIFNIDLVYDYFLRETGLPLTLGVGFAVKGKDRPHEANLVIDFMHLDDKPEPVEDVYFVPMKNYLVSDDIVARAYINFDPEYRKVYEKAFVEIAETLVLKGMGGAGSDKGPRPDLH
jgi:hypothetical protein